MPLDDEEDDEDEEEDDEDELLLLDEEEASPDEDELLLDDEEASPEEDALLLELEVELLLTSEPVEPPEPPLPAVPPMPLVEDEVPLAAPAPDAVTGCASLHAPPNVAAQIVINPVNRASFLAESIGEKFVLEWCFLGVCTA